MKLTFGIITGGDKPITDLLQSIDAQNIPSDDYEIIVVGGPAIQWKNLRHIPFNENQKWMWITKKKQIICEQARFPNVVLMHDYVLFDKGWYEGWLKFGDDWDVAMNVILNGDGTRFRDWIAWEPLASVPYEVVGYHPTQYISGTYWLAKKDFMLKHPLDINLSWCQGEDLEWSFRCRGFWNFKMNPNSTIRCNKQKETWGVTGENGAQNYIHYEHLVRIINATCELKVVHDNGVISFNGVKSIPYGDFDTLRNDIRKLQSKHIAVVGDPIGLTALAAVWVASETGAKVSIADYCGDPSAMRLPQCLIRQFQWDKFVDWKPMSSPAAISDVGPIDMLILCGTYDSQLKLKELKSAKLAPNASVYICNSIDDSIKQETPNGVVQGAFYKWHSSTSTS